MKFYRSSNEPTLVGKLAIGAVATVLLASSLKAAPFHTGNNGLEETTPLMAAVQFGNASKVAALIQAGADVNEAVPNDGNPLILAARYGNIEIVKMLIDNGADVNGYVLHDETPLIGAAANGRLEVARLLIDNGAKVNLRVDSGHRSSRPMYRSPLGQAKLYGHNNMVALLLAKGAIPTTGQED